MTSLCKSVRQGVLLKEMKCRPVDILFLNLKENINISRAIKIQEMIIPN